MDQHHNIVLVATPEARPYVRMVIERLFATLPCLISSRDRAWRRSQINWNDFMTTIGSDAVLTAFVLFCRIGGCLMLMPGL